jgi:hypothetical protein
LIESVEYKLSSASSVNLSIAGIELTSEPGRKNISLFNLYSGNSKPTLDEGTFKLRLVGAADGMLDAAYDVTASSVPLPVAAWLIGATLVEFSLFSTRRVV